MSGWGSRRWWVVLCVAALPLLGGCLSPLPGSEHIRLLRDQTGVFGAEFVDSKTGTTDPDGVHDLSIIAKNFAIKHKADIAVVNLQPITPKKIQYKIEAWKSRPESDQ